MVEMVFALLLLQDHKIIEHRYHESLSKCMKARRYAMKDRNPEDRVVFKSILRVFFRIMTQCTDYIVLYS